MTPDTEKSAVPTFSTGSAKVTVHDTEDAPVGDDPLRTMEEMVGAVRSTVIDGPLTGPTTEFPAASLIVGQHHSKRGLLLLFPLSCPIGFTVFSWYKV